MQISLVFFVDMLYQCNRFLLIFLPMHPMDFPLTIMRGGGILYRR